MPLLKQKRFDLYPQIASPASNPDEMSSYQFGHVVINSKTVFFKTSYTLAFVNKKCAVPGRILFDGIRNLFTSAIYFRFFSLILPHRCTRFPS